MPRLNEYVPIGFNNYIKFDNYIKYDNFNNYINYYGVDNLIDYNKYDNLIDYNKYDNLHKKNKQYVRENKFKNVSDKPLSNPCPNKKPEKPNKPNKFINCGISTSKPTLRKEQANKSELI